MAEDEAERLRVQIKLGTFSGAAGASTETELSPPETLEAYGRQWLRTAGLNLKVSSIRFYTDHLENHVFPELGSRAVGEIARKDCRTLITTCREKGLKIGTVRGIVRTLSTVLSQAVEDDLLPANPALQMRKHLKRGAEPQAEPDPFTKDEAAHVLSVASQHFPEWYGWLLCGLRTGMRAGELLALQWSDIDWRGSFISLNRNLVRGVITTPKNHQRRRVDMSRQLRATLRLWRRQQSAQMGHKDSSITLRVYARWLPDGSGRKGVDSLDSAAVAKNLQRPASVTVSRTA